MNRTYKVAKSLTRGVVVTSEKASSYQGKAVKTVIAAAAALVACSAIAAPSYVCLLYTSPSPRDYAASRMPSSA